MLSRTSDEQAYVATSRAMVQERIAAFDALGASPKRDRFEPLFTASMVLVLEQLFVHRARGREGKDGNPLNEVRVLSNAIMSNGSVMVKDTQIKLDPATSVLGMSPGDDIHLTSKEVSTLADAFFDEIEARFGET